MPLLSVGSSELLIWKSVQQIPTLNRDLGRADLDYLQQIPRFIDWVVSKRLLCGAQGLFKHVQLLIPISVMAECGWEQV